jgi:hypothetical protein
MEIECIEPFGNCEVGDVRVIPDGAEFSSMYFKEHKPEPVKLSLPKGAGPPGKDMQKNTKAPLKSTTKKEG